MPRMGLPEAHNTLLENESLVWVYPVQKQIIVVIVVEKRNADLGNVNHLS